MENVKYNIKSMNYDTASSLLDNPNRGFRMEAYITLGEKLTTYPTKDENPYDIIDNIIYKYSKDKPKLCQLYVYLSNYRDDKLDEIALYQLEKVFKQFKNNDIRLLLRFAYSTESITDVPYKKVKAHINQIKEWFENNKTLVNDVLYCLQTGFIGLWGEGHSYRKLCFIDIPRVINDVCDIAPVGIYTQVRNYKMLRKVQKRNIKKVGFHDDYIVGDLNHKWAIVPKRKARIFTNVIENSKYTINDGEMPWGYAHYNDNPNDKLCDNLNGIDILKQLSIYHLTSFSLEHSYKENGASYSMEKWKDIRLSFDDIKKIGVIVNPNLFKNSNGEDVLVSVYEIIRYHLGYQLLLKDCYVKNNVFYFTIINYGFSAPLNANYLAVVVENNDIYRDIEVENYNKNSLQSGCYIQYKIDLNNNDKVIGIKMDFFKDRGINIKFANELKFSNGVNIL